MRINSDVDIDLANRDSLLSIIQHVPAAMHHAKTSTQVNHQTPIRKHATGIYITDIPYDPVNHMAALDYREAENRGYFKLDLLNVHVYDNVKNEEHLVQLMQEPDWNMLQDKTIVEKLIHLNNSYYAMQRMPEPVTNIPRLAMFLAIIRPAKKHLQGLTWKEVAKTVWDKDQNKYSFKKSHAIAYAQLVVVHMNLLKEQACQV